jgi:hypothetical protein
MSKQNTGYIYRDFTKDWGCFTVGHYTPEGVWESESDHNTSEAAAARVHWLNGGKITDQPQGASHA